MWKCAAQVADMSSVNASCAECRAPRTKAGERAPASAACSSTTARGRLGASRATHRHLRVGDELPFCGGPPEVVSWAIPPVCAASGGCETTGDARKGRHTLRRRGWEAPYFCRLRNSGDGSYFE